MAAAPASEARNPDHGAPMPEQARWSLPKRIAFRFVFCYFVLYCMPQGGRIDILQSIGLEILVKHYENLWKAMCPWVAIHVFHLSGQAVTYFPTGSGDTTLAYMENLLYVVFAIVGMAVWSILDRKRLEYRALNAWFRLLVRYTLALSLLGYGFAKVVPQQFRTPPPARFMEPYGEFSPMGVLWSFMGTSLPYVVFSGSAEVLGGLLLLFRRTSTLGALVAFGVVANVVALNFCYDVPVKLYSSNLLLMSVLLAVPHLRRLMDALVLNRATTPGDDMAVRFERRRLRVGATVVWMMFLVWVLGSSVVEAYSAYQRQFVTLKHSPIFGVWDVAGFRMNGRELVLATDKERWRTVAFGDGGMVVRDMDEKVVQYPGKYDADKGILTTKGNTVSWRFEGEELVVKGLDGAEARLRKADDKRWLLKNRDFHWITERPFNR